MSVPLDRLYHYIENISNRVYGDVVIYHFWPHGSKKLENLRLLHDLHICDRLSRPPLVCHDQEPLNYDLYQSYVLPYYFVKLQLEYGYHKPRNLRPLTIFDQTVLLHSEKQSTEVEKYQANGFIPVYYWSHAMIALDWFRFAQHLEQRKQTKKLFLVYNRAWAGTREYRIKFSGLLQKHNLVDCCMTSFNVVDPETGVSYENHAFQNPVWRTDQDLSQSFSPNTVSSHSSASFDFEDYEFTNIEVVLETLFDDHRIHLTEKILRPIACGQPFVLAATSGSLSYLRDYGFKTYDDIWNEDYDQIADPCQRLEAIVQLMKEISAWDPETRDKKLQQAQDIADYNKKHFFSQNFFDLINSELTQNLKTGLQQLVSTNTCSRWLEGRKEMAQYPKLKNILTGRDQYINQIPDEHKQELYIKTQDLVKVLQVARQYYMRSLPSLESKLSTLPG